MVFISWIHPQIPLIPQISSAGFHLRDLHNLWIGRSVALIL